MKLGVYTFLFFVFFGCEVQQNQSTDHNSNSTKPNEMTEETSSTNELSSLEGHPLMFYNVENLFDTENDPTNEGDDEFTPDSEKKWSDDRYETKLERIAEVMTMPTGKLPFVMGFCEIENKRVLQDLINQEALKAGNYKIVHFDSDDRRGIDVGLIYDSKRFKVETEEKIVVRIKDEPEFKTRDILYVSGKVKNNEKLHVFVNHWSSKREGEEETKYRRIAAAKILRVKIDEILDKDPDANILLMGDFNDTPMHESVRTHLRSKGQHELKTGDLANLMWKEQNDGLGSIVHDRKWEVFDHIIVSQELLKERNLYIEKNDGHILKEEKLIFKRTNGDEKPNATYGVDKYYGGYSDHLPVYVLFNHK